jgi:ketosteroid isomerase-like protein
MKRTSGYSYAILFFFLFAGGLHAQPPHPENWRSERQIIETSNAQYFADIARQDQSSFSKHYADDCWIMVPGMAIHCGPTAAVDYFRELVQKKNVANGKFILIDLYGVSDGVLAEIGFYQFYDRAGTQIDDGKYITLWKRTKGHWKKFRESISTSR